MTLNDIKNLAREFVDCRSSRDRVEAQNMVEFTAINAGFTLRDIDQAYEMSLNMMLEVILGSDFD